MSEAKVYELRGAKLHPKTSLVVLHNQLTKEVYIDFASRFNYYLELENHQIVTVADISFIEAYFGCMGDQEKMVAVATIERLAHRAANISVYETCKKGSLPKNLKLCYYRALKKLRRLYDGSFMTAVFLKKLRSLLMTIWHHGQVFRRFQSLGNTSVELITEFSC